MSLQTSAVVDSLSPVPVSAPAALITEPALPWRIISGSKFPREKYWFNCPIFASRFILESRSLILDSVMEFLLFDRHDCGCLVHGNSIRVIAALSGGGLALVYRNHCACYPGKAYTRISHILQNFDVLVIT